MSEDTFSKICLAVIGGSAFFAVCRSARLPVVCGTILAGWVSLAACSWVMFYLHLDTQPETFIVYLFGLSLPMGWLPVSLIGGIALFIRLCWRFLTFRFQSFRALGML